MSEQSFVFDPRMFITGPRRPCPRCGQAEFGTLSITNNVHTRRCGGCFHYEEETLPPLAKRMIYLDQMVISDIAKKLDPVSRAEKPHVDDFWLEAFDRIDRLVKLQLIVCPNSPIHEVESSYAERYEPVLPTPLRGIWRAASVSGSRARYTWSSCRKRLTLGPRGEIPTGAA